MSLKPFWVAYEALSTSSRSVMEWRSSSSIYSVHVRFPIKDSLDYIAVRTLSADVCQYCHADIVDRVIDLDPPFQ